jgi:hypothetical protein
MQSHRTWKTSYVIFSLAGSLAARVFAASDFFFFLVLHTQRVSVCEKILFVRPDAKHPEQSEHQRRARSICFVLGCIVCAF